MISITRIAAALGVSLSELIAIKVPPIQKRKMDNLEDTVDSEEFEEVKRHLSYHIVAFVDILGQSNLLRQMADVPSTPEEWERFVPFIKQTKGAVDLFHRIFERLVADFQINKLPSRQMSTPEKQRAYDAVDNSNLKSFSFSDFIIAHSTLHDTGDNYPIIDVWYTLLACAHMAVVMLRIEKPIRGGIAIGAGFDGELYGNPYCVAHDIESHCAKWPRIVIHDRLSHYLWCLDGLDETDPRRPLVLKFRSLCSDLIAVDIDGQLVLDYLGQGHRDVLSTIPENLMIFSEQVHLAYAYAKAQHEHFIEVRDHKLAGYYSMLRSYMESRLHLWTVKG